MTEIPSTMLATNAWRPSADAVTSCGSLPVGTRPRTVPLAGSTIARALASLNRTRSRPGEGVWALAMLNAATIVLSDSDATHRSKGLTGLIWHLRL